MKAILFQEAVWQAKQKVLDQDGEAQTRRLEASLAILNANSEKVSYQGRCANGLFKFYVYTSGQFPCNYPVEHHLKPRYLPGETVYRGEALHKDMELGDTCYDDENMTPVFRNGVFGELVKWPWPGKVKQSPMFMPAKYARDFLKILDVRPERLQSITEEDAIAEGCRSGLLFPGNPYFRPGHTEHTAKEDYSWLWGRHYAKSGHPWSKNDWVWCYVVERTERP